MSKGEDEENGESSFLVFIATGVMFLSLGTLYLFLDDFSQVSSWLFVVSGVLFFVAAFLTRY
jgi:uncharacterized membrane protein HdeD (DUF308 family)